MTETADQPAGSMRGAEHAAVRAERGTRQGAKTRSDAVARSGAGRRSWSTYVWVAVVLAVALTAVILGWRAQGGVPNPGAAGARAGMGTTSAVIDSGILVFREGLEAILVLAAVTASLRGADGAHRRPIAAGGALALAASVGTWFLAIWLTGAFGGSGLQVQAATGIPAIVVLLAVMNWFFHRVYWTGWISHHNRRRRQLMAGAAGPAGAAMLGFGLLGFTSVYREGFEVVIFLQSLRVQFGSSVVLEGVVIGLLFTAAAGVLTFVLHRRLPYKRLLVMTGALLLCVLWVMVGEEVNEMQLAGWIPTTPIPGLHIPGWAGTWLSLFANVETIAAQLAAVGIVVGSYALARYLRVWRPRRRGPGAATRAGRARAPAPKRGDTGAAAGARSVAE